MESNSDPECLGTAPQLHSGLGRPGPKHHHDEMLPKHGQSLLHLSDWTYTIIAQCFSTQPHHPNPAIDAMEQERRLAKHSMTPVMGSEITVLPGKTQTKSFVASSQLSA